MFSHRVPHVPDPNALATAEIRVRASGRRVLDLAAGNPTTVGLRYPPDAIAPLGDPRGLEYRPAPFGSLAARDAVSADFARRGLDVPPSRIVLSASTSEAYSWVFKLLCDPGDEVLVPQPSYPLFEHLASFDGVRAVPYRLEYHGIWSVARESVGDAWSPRTRAVLVVSPNNPTGSMSRAGDLAWLAAECASRDAALVSDEVFADYPISPADDVVESAVAPGGLPPGTLTMTLGGLSKSAGLPQVKVGWLALSGPDGPVAAALARLELIADTYLSVGTPAQLALPALLATGAEIRAAIRERIAVNHATLQGVAARHPACTALRIEGGWSAVVRVPANRPEEELVVRLLDDEGVLVHPGYFFDFPHEAFVVISLLPPPDQFEEGLTRALQLASR